MGRRARARRPTSAGRGTADKGKGGTAARAAVATDGLVCGRRRGSLHVPEYLNCSAKGRLGVTTAARPGGQMTRRLCGCCRACGYLPHTVLNLITSINHQPSRRTKENINRDASQHDTRNRHRQTRCTSDTGNRNRQRRPRPGRIRANRNRQTTRTLDTGKQDMSNVAPQHGQRQLGNHNYNSNSSEMQIMGA